MELHDATPPLSAGVLASEKVWPICSSNIKLKVECNLRVWLSDTGTDNDERHRLADKRDSALRVNMPGFPNICW